MADPPRPPPYPPLPLRSVPRPEPEEPFEVDRAVDTERSWPRRDAIPPPALDPLTETTAQLLRRELALVRETLPTLPVVPQVTITRVGEGPGSLAPASLRTMTKRAIAARLGKWSALGFLLPVIGAAVAKRWPEYQDVVDWVTAWWPQ